MSTGFGAVGSQPAGDLVINLVVGCHYFLLGTWLPSHLKSITAPWLLPKYTAIYTGVNSLPKATAFA